MEKPNREKLRKLMGAHDISADEVADMLGMKAATIHQYRSISGHDISDVHLDYLKLKLAEINEQ